MTRRSLRSSEVRNADLSPFDVYLRKHGTCAICLERRGGPYIGVFGVPGATG